VTRPGKATRMSDRKARRARRRRLAGKIARSRRTNAYNFV